MASGFPRDAYTPYGYIDNPWHSAVLNPSGVFRTVPPLGMGYWCRNLPFPYGDGFGLLRRLNYLSFLLPSVSIGGRLFAREEDFRAARAELISPYHTKNLLACAFSFGGVSVEIAYFLAGEDALTAELTVTAQREAHVRMCVGHMYGYPEQRCWGCDGYTGRREGDRIITKGFAYGDVFALGADTPCNGGLMTTDPSALEAFRISGDGSQAQHASSIAPEPVFGALAYEKCLAAGESWRLACCLSRDKNEEWALVRLHKALQNAAAAKKALLDEDAAFYAGVPRLAGDWPDCWRRGWIYHFETVRMTIRPPMGIYKHPWDGMQVHTPRLVLGETAIDCMLLSYADPDLAKTVLLGTFQDAISPQVPCTREDGSVNMIGQEGEECATSPIWVLLFPTIRSIYARTGDKAWLKALYPYLKRYVEWWLLNRADREGFLHVACSWEAQDGSKRFQVEYDEQTTCGADTSGVRTVDLQAAVADGVRDLADYARLLGLTHDAMEHDARFELMQAQCASMYVDGRFRDFDGRTGKPIIIDDYFDVMMLTPYAVGMTGPGQDRGSRALFQYFVDHPTHWLEWPSFLYIYTEAARRAGWPDIAAQVAGDAAAREYPKLDARALRSPMIGNRLGLPEPYFYRIPGVGNEFWAIRPDNPGGCENYGWGSTLPTLMLRSVLGYTETGGEGFQFAPCLPRDLKESGKVYRVENLTWRGVRMDASMEVLEEGIRLTVSPAEGGRLPFRAFVQKGAGEIPLAAADGTFCAKLTPGEAMKFR